MNSFNFKYPDHRPRRIRGNAVLREMLRETRFSAEQLMMPYFVRAGRNIKEPIASMPGQYRFSPDALLKELDTLASSGVRSILLFGLPETKDEKASASYSSKSVIVQAVKAIKKRFPEIAVTTDVCLCAYTNHGHCGLLSADGYIKNDASLGVLAKMALAHAEAGVDMLSPSDMMDGRIQAIRSQLDGKGFEELPLMSYSAKYSSSFYGPFRDAAHSAPAQSEGLKRPAPKDRKGYQMDFSNREEALREIALDIQEGTDIILIKPVLAYLDILREAKNTFCFPTAAYIVSGEYAMVKAAAQKGWVNEKESVLEILTSVFRAGADLVITYHAKEAAIWGGSK